MKVTYLHFDFQRPATKLSLTADIRDLYPSIYGFAFALQKKFLFRYMVGFCYAKLTANY